MQNTDEELTGILKAAVYDINLRELGDISAATKISDIGLDSVSLMELIGVLEESFSIRIKDEEVASLSCVGDLLNLIRNSSFITSGLKRNGALYSAFHRGKNVR